MNTYVHSVSLDKEKCTGCTTCLRHCPTEAIRVKDGCAVINPDRCIDCGECIRVCPQKAKRAECNKFSDMERFKWRIALPAPTLYGQFEELDDIDYCVVSKDEESRRYYKHNLRNSKRNIVCLAYDNESIFL